MSKLMLTAETPRTQRERRVNSEVSLPSSSSLRNRRALGVSAVKEIYATNCKPICRAKAPSARYSRRNAASGSTFVARRAGIQQASNATAASSDESSANVVGSVTLT
jgi:hypothetical protein